MLVFFFFFFFFLVKISIRVCVYVTQSSLEAIEKWIENVCVGSFVHFCPDTPRCTVLGTPCLCQLWQREVSDERATRPAAALL
jgi:hypothetical protein